MQRNLKKYFNRNINSPADSKIIEPWNHSRDSMKLIIRNNFVECYYISKFNLDIVPFEHPKFV